MHNPNIYNAYPLSFKLFCHSLVEPADQRCNATECVAMKQCDCRLQCEIGRSNDFQSMAIGARFQLRARHYRQARTTRGERELEIVTEYLRGDFKREPLAIEGALGLPGIRILVGLTPILGEPILPTSIVDDQSAVRTTSLRRRPTHRCPTR